MQMLNVTKAELAAIWWCVGTAESWPKPLIEHLEERPGQS